MKELKLKIAPSILSADFSRLESEIKAVEKAGADMLHVDVMDGHFVPNITIGPAVVSAISKRTNLPLDVHLMIKDPQFFLKDFVQAGSKIITVHVEVCSEAQIREMKKYLTAHKVKLGVTLNPGTKVERVYPVLALADMVLVMSVNPGFGGQAFMDSVLPKIEKLRKRFRGDIQVDGGISDKTAPLVLSRGANVLVAGSYIFGAKNRKQRIESLRRCGK